MTNLMMMGAGGRFPDISIISQPITNYYVSNDGNDGWSGLDVDHPWQTINKVNGFSFSPTDQINFNCADSWAERLYPAVSGLSGSPIVVDKYGTGALPIWDASTSIANAFNVNGKSYWHLKNIDLRGGTSYTAMVNTVGVCFYNCNIQGNNTSSANGISFFAGANNNVVDSCTLFNHKCLDSGGAGIYASSASNITLTNNTIYSCGQDIYDHGIYLSYCYTGTIQKNTCYSNTGHGIQVQDYSTGINIDKNYCYSNGYYGIFVGILDESNNIAVTNNKCYANTNTGIYLGTSAPDILCAFNTIVNNGASGTGNGLHVGEHGCTIKNNLIMQDASVVGNCRPMRFQDDDVLADGAVFDNNLYYYTSTTDWSSTTVKIIARTSSAAGYTFTEWKARAEAPDSHGVSADPVFVTNYSNLHLQTTSPAKNAGVAIAGIGYDFDSVARGDPPEIGCYEFV